MQITTLLLSLLLFLTVVLIGYALKYNFPVVLCDVFRHSFSAIDVLKFKIECEGRCYTVNTLTGERRPWEGKPEIRCRRCGECFSHNVTTEAR